MTLPPNARLFTSDADSMYTNIPTAPALQIISEYLVIHEREFSYNAVALISALELVMTNNIFQFGDLVYKQLTGTAMGTPPAPPWATIFFGILEISLLRHFQQHLSCLFFYKRFIDDVIGIWLCHPDPEEDSRLWTAFKTKMNSFHNMRWITSKRDNTVDFMDLTIGISNGKIHTTLFEKKLNLYLYIPPHSAHPPGVLAGLIIGQILRFHQLCTNNDDVVLKTKQLFLHLLARGYSCGELLPLFSKGLLNAEKFLSQPLAV